MKPITSIVWFRNDLRMADHEALLEACKQNDVVLPVYIWNPTPEHSWSHPGAASRSWLHRSLQVFGQSLKQQHSRLILRQGEALHVLLELIKETGAKAVYWNRCYEPHLYYQDLIIEKELTAHGIRVKTCPGSLLFEPGSISNKQGNPYKVFTPFWKYILSLDISLQPSSCPSSLKPAKRWPRSLKVDALGLKPAFDWDSGIFDYWTPGEASAKKELKCFLKKNIEQYDIQRDQPDIQGTSRLSPHLHFGEISPRTLWSEIPLKHRNIPYLRQLIWREFANHLLFHFPHTMDKPLSTQFEKFPWHKNKRKLQAWQKGQTGYPVVDAGMRELWQTGWMHNRVRMIAASFLVKDLMIPWQEGAKWFWDTLVDADLANNTMGWQWVAGCGADASPFFRIFNPMTQGEKFDKQGIYVRRWVPEIAKIPTKWIHKPWMALHSDQEKASVIIGKDYPEPIVDHSMARESALKAYHRLKC